MRDPSVDTRWHVKAFAALGIALACAVAERLFPDQGYSTFRVAGSEFGLARIKSLAFVIWHGERFRFPFDGLVFLVAAASLTFAIVVTRRHFRSRRAGA